MGTKEYFALSKYSQGKFKLKNPEKYVGKKQPTYRSSWEWAVMQFCDNHPNVISWASEAIHINYYNPFTEKNTIYVPDFFITYRDKNGKQHSELVEIKPSGEILETVGKSQRQKAIAALNHFKWEAAKKWCEKNGVTFRIVTEKDLFHNPKQKQTFKVRN
jgi:TnsA endonuclease N terminal